MPTDSPLEIFRSAGGDALLALLDEVDLPVSDLANGHPVVFYGCGSEEAPIGIIGLEQYGDVGLLRSLAVRPDRQGQGIARALVAGLENAAREQGITSLYLLTTTAESYFLRRGYAHTERESAPLSIQKTKEYAELCPTGSAFMVKHFDKDPLRT